MFSRRQLNATISMGFLALAATATSPALAAPEAAPAVAPVRHSDGALTKLPTPAYPKAAAAWVQDSPHPTVPTRLQVLEQVFGRPNIPKISHPTQMEARVATPRKTLTGPAFDGDRPRSTDVFQGEVGDCYFLSPLSAVAAKRPDLLKDAISELPDGTIKVRLYERHEDKNGKPWFSPVEVRVTKRIPVEKGMPVYVDSRDRATWPMLFEKAYAALRGGYDKINEGGFGVQGLEALTGRPTEYITVDAKDPNAVVSKIEAAIRDNRPVTAGTRDTRDFRRQLKALEKDDPRSPLLETLRNAGGNAKTSLWKMNLVPSHEYAVLGVGEKEGQKFVVLRNPWGRLSPRTASVDGRKRVGVEDDGVYALPATEFAMIFGDTSIVQ